MDFRPLSTVEWTLLLAALRGNAEADRAILMDRRDTTFSGTANEVPDSEVIGAIQSVPCHYKSPVQHGAMWWETTLPGHKWPV
jgi:hypothetical protein